MFSSMKSRAYADLYPGKFLQMLLLLHPPQCILVGVKDLVFQLVQLKCVSYLHWDR